MIAGGNKCNLLPQFQNHEGIEQQGALNLLLGINLQTDAHSLSLKIKRRQPPGESEARNEDGKLDRQTQESIHTILEGKRGMRIIYES